ncbi:DUF47 family protein [Halobaculum sp. MBLA0147]|uniref:DUF47 family protein n=1 Tax=Halobaculum sp. MBLA0147 TaxID=3079934 RepID=UPI0035244B31
MTTDGDFRDTLLTRTEAYLEDAAACVDLLPDLLSAYAAEEDYEAVAHEIQRLESDCDETLRAISAHLANTDAREMGLLSSRVHVNTPSLLDLYQEVDAVVNLAERIAEELLVVPLDPETAAFDGLVEMAADATRAVAALETVVTEFVDLLSAPEASGSLGDEVTTIREIESACDGHRNDTLASAFGDETVPDPHRYREFALLFDRLVDGVEDITDQMWVIASDDPSLVVEADGE